MAKKVLFKIAVYDDASTKIEKGDDKRPIKLDPDISKMQSMKLKKVRKTKHVTIFETNPTWVFIGGRWIRIG